MMAHRSDVETVLLDREAGRDEGEDIRRNAVDAGEGIPPLANCCQCK